MKRLKGLSSRDQELQNSHGDINYSAGNIVNNIVTTMSAARGVFETWGEITLQRT